MIRSLADRAWGEGRLLDDEASSESSWPLISAALLAVDELERDLELCDAALARGAERGSMTEQAVASLCRAWPLYEQGEIALAAESAKAAVDVLPMGVPGFFRTAYGAIALCHLQRGELDRADTALGIIERPELRSASQLPWLLICRAQLRLAQRQPRAALDDAVTAGGQWESNWGAAAATPNAFPWRSIAARAQLALGRASDAHQLVSEELAAAETSGAMRLVIRNRRLLGLIEGGRRGLGAPRVCSPSRRGYLLRGWSTSPRSSRWAVGLRRANQRAAARKPLLQAIKLSQKGGAIALAHQAHEELVATGARPRTTARWGPEALTPSERRVAELAADRLTTREIAESLFVTPKTVEFHLRHIYQKLGVNSRDRLSAALRGDASTSDS